MCLAQKNLIDMLQEAGRCTKNVQLIHKKLTKESILHLWSSSECRLLYGNCFWADALSRLAYQYLGDVVIFYATYLTNCCGMPFVPFTGVNHHHHSSIFGCALRVNETIESYMAIKNLA
ncbi:hypothetical protein ACSBR2_042366 [Camellia fascicularis]